MEEQQKLSEEVVSGIIKDNPVFALALGLCPTLAVTTSFANALGMGLAFTFVMLGSSLLIAVLRKQIPGMVRLPIFIVIIATFVTVVDMALEAYLPAMYVALGIFVPLIVVNCIVLGRIEAHSSKNPVLPALANAFGVSIGFTLALLLIGSIRELFGTGKLAVVMLWLQDGQPAFLELATLSIPIQPAAIMLLPPGAFMTIGGLLLFFQFTSKKMKEIRRAKEGGVTTNA